jgi:hypothetical protein
VQQPLAAGADDLPGDLVADGVHAGDLAVVPEGRRVRDREVGLLAIPVPLQQQLQRGEPRRLERGHRVRDRRAQGVPGRRQRLPDVVADRGVLRTDHRRVSVVVELGESRAPGQHHGKARDQHRADRVAQAGRPRLHRPDRCARPVERGHQPSGLTAGGEQLAPVGSRRGIGGHAHLQPKTGNHRGSGRDAPGRQSASASTTAPETYLAKLGARSGPRRRPTGARPRGRCRRSAR